MSDYIANKKIYYIFEHSALTTGLTNASFTSQAYKNGVADSTGTITVTELSGGLYLSTFTPNADGQWHCDVYETATPGTRYSNSFVVGATSSSAITTETLNTNLTTAQNTIIAAIDIQELSEIKRLCQAIIGKIEGS